MEKFLPLILEYDMSKEEALAFRLAILYMQLARQYFPNYNHVGLPKKGDPRKSELFRYCWKMLKEADLTFDEYRPYIQSQLAILKNIKIGEDHPLIHPRCLVGKVAWRRWGVWKKYFEQAKKTRDVKLIEDYTPIIKRELQDTLDLLRNRLKKLSKKTLQEALESRYLFRLASIGAVSVYFLAMNDLVAHFLAKNPINLSMFNIDLEQAQLRITPEALAFYNELMKGIHEA